MNEMLHVIRQIQSSDFKVPGRHMGMILALHFLISGFALGKIEILQNIINLIARQGNREEAIGCMLLLAAATGIVSLLRHFLTRYVEWCRMQTFQRHVCMMTDKNLMLRSWKDSRFGTSDRYLLMTREIGGICGQHLSERS